MKRKLAKRNKTKFSKILKMNNLWRSIMLNDRCNLKQTKRTSYNRVERFDLAYTHGKRGRIMVPIFRSSKNKKSRIQNQPDGCRCVSSIESYNEIYNQNKTLDQIPKKSVTGKDLG